MRVCIQQRKTAANGGLGLKAKQTANVKANVRKKITSANQFENLDVTYFKMSKTKLLRDFVNKRLAAAAEEIFVAIERAMVDYAEEVTRMAISGDNNTKSRAVVLTHGTQRTGLRLCVSHSTTILSL